MTLSFLVPPLLACNSSGKNVAFCSSGLSGVLSFFSFPIFSSVVNPDKFLKNRPSKTIFRLHETSKKREYLQRVLEVEHATFTQLVIGTNGGMGDECGRFVSELENKLSLKQDEPYASIMSWIRTKLSFEILRSATMCMRESRIPWRSRTECNRLVDDIEFNARVAEMC